MKVFTTNNSDRKKRISKKTAHFISVIMLFFIWIIAARKINTSLILPYPAEVFKISGRLLGGSDFWRNFAYTFGRCILSFLISFMLGVIIGIMCSLSTFLNHFFELPVAIIRATPVAAFILIVLFWFKSGSVPIFVSVMMTLPIVISAVTTGFSSYDKKLLDMSQCFCLSKKDIFYYVKLPSAVPFILNGAVSSFGLTWKVVVAGEVLSLPENATGTLLQRYQVHLESGYVLATAIILVTFSFILQEIFAFFVRLYLKKHKDL